MAYQPYPRSLYRPDRNGEHVIVQDAEEERARRKEGFVKLTEVEPPFDPVPPEFAPAGVVKAAEVKPLEPTPPLPQEPPQKRGPGRPKAK